jgi:hypothetical protein
MWSPIPSPNEEALPLHNTELTPATQDRPSEQEEVTPIGLWTRLRQVPSIARGWWNSESAQAAADAPISGHSDEGEDEETERRWAIERIEQQGKWHVILGQMVRQFMRDFFGIS